ncbi:MAG: hypothetical protein NW201_07005 [Gemmatimonadales bacterium]|nr:hypothetical protein [Gemmatimonadales bacterium]
MGHLPDGRVVFVPRAAPGDLIELARVREERRFARAEVGRVTEPGADRVAPPCPHYERDRCGGCQLQHLSAPAQRAARRRIVGDALRRLAKLDVDDPPLEPAPADLGYRTRITLHALEGNARRLGYHRLGEPGQVFDVEDCLLAVPAVRELWRALRDERGLLPRDVADLTLRLDDVGGCHVLLRVRGTTPWNEAGRLAAALERAGTPATIWWQPEGGAARAVAGSDDPFPATVFEQVHPAMGDAAREWAIAALGEVRGEHGWDLFAGLGQSAAALARAGATVDAVEADRRAVRHGEGVTGAAGLAVRWHAGTCEAVVPALDAAPAFAIVNPPRAGLHVRVAEALTARAPSRLAYIACDPATLARDLGRLPAHRVARVHAFDLFPQTAHVETVVLLERR